MRVQDLIAITKAAQVSQDCKARMLNILRSVLDNLDVIKCRNSLESIHAKRRRVERTLQGDFPYVSATLSDIFALPEVTHRLVVGERRGRSHDFEFEVESGSLSDSGSDSGFPSHIDSDSTASESSDSGSTSASEGNLDSVDVVSPVSHQVRSDVNSTMVIACCVNAVMAFSSMVCVVAMWNDIRAKL
jgi:hypothetical protein